MKPQDRSLMTRESVRGRLNVTGAARRDAVAQARGELPSYTDADVEEITGKFAALSANAAANATANALTEHRETAPAEGSEELAQVARIAWKHRAKMTGLLASGASALVALWQWLRHR